MIAFGTITHASYSSPEILGKESCQNQLSMKKTKNIIMFARFIPKTIGRKSPSVVLCYCKCK